MKCETSDMSPRLPFAAMRSTGTAEHTAVVHSHWMFAVTVYRFSRDRSGGVGVEGGLGGGRVGGEEFVEEREGLLVLAAGRAQDGGKDSEGVGACFGTGAEGYLS